MKIVYDQEIPYIEEFFHSQGELVAISADEISPEILRDASAVLVRSVTHINSPLLDNSSIRFVGSATAGIDHIDTHYLDQANIAWSYAPGCNAKAVADYVILSVAHLIQSGVLKNQKGRAGVIGIGHVGQQVVNALTQLGFEVLINDLPRADNETDFISTPLDQFYDLDIICLHTPLAKTGPHPTFHLINQEFLSNFNSQGVLVNAGRGACVDTEALKNSNVTTVLDVWENEPNIDMELAQSAFIATPHIAGYSQPAKYRATKQLYEAFCKHFEVDHYSLPEENVMEFVNIDFSKKDWIDQVLPIENLLKLTQNLKTSCLNNTAKAFTELRKNYRFRQEIL